ncbi:MAG: hypothetical protein QXU59_05720 [Pyrobaculum sp.]
MAAPHVSGVVAMIQASCKRLETTYARRMKSSPPLPET